MKKINLLALALALVMMLTACSLPDISITINNKDNSTTTTTEAPVVTTEAPVETTEAPVETTEAPVETTEAPVETTEAPVETTEAPVETTEAPVETTEAPVETTEAPVETTEAPAASSEVSVSLKELGSFKKEGGIQVSYNSPVMRVDTVAGETTAVLYSNLGELKYDKSCINYDDIGDGLVSFYVAGENHAVCGLVNINTGEELLAPGAAKIEKLTDRYFSVTYTTEQTDNQDECFIYFTDSWFSLSPSEEDVLYKGYAQIFDAVEKKMVENIKITDPGMDVVICGDYICLETDWNDYDMYAADGTKVRSLTDCYVGASCIISQTGRVVTVYDPEFNVLFEADNASLIDGTDKYLSFRNEDSLKGIYDLQGNVVLEPQFDYIYSINGDYIRAEKDEMEGITHINGTVVCEYIYDSIYQRGDIAVEARDDSKEYLIILGGNAVEITDMNYHDDFCYYTKPNEDDYSTYEYILINSGEKLTLKNSSSVCDGLVYADEGLVELFSGKVLLDNKFDRFIWANNCLYGLKGDTYTVYEVVIQ